MARSVARAELIRLDPYRVSSAVEHREAMCIGCTIGNSFVDISDQGTTIVVLGVIGLTGSDFDFG